MSITAGWIILIVAIALIFIIPVAIFAYIASMIEETVRKKENKWDE
jgi:hypothetical protein